MAQYKLLLVEDDLSLAMPLKDFFEDNGFTVFFAEDGEVAMKIYKQRFPDILILDVDLPKKNGFEVIEEIRALDYLTPIIMMTGSYIDAQSEIRGYELGAINYIKKPAIPQVVLAQVNYRLNPPVNALQIKIGDRVFSLRNQELTIENKVIQFRERDAKVLSALFEHKGEVVSRKLLLTKVWGSDRAANEKMLDGIIFRIKEALMPFPEIVLKSSYGKGYLLKEC
ncbi:MAG: response regulator transcription factor [Bacteroidales bacterium]|nr:response regulator transcription factor [Bacteroidales bacterium]